MIQYLDLFLKVAFTALQSFINMVSCLVYVYNYDIICIKKYRIHKCFSVRLWIPSTSITGLTEKDLVSGNKTKPLLHVVLFQTDSRRTKQTLGSPEAPVADSSGLEGAASWSGACWWDWNWPGQKTRNLNQRPWHSSHSGKDNRKWELGHLSWETRISSSTPPFNSNHHSGDDIPALRCLCLVHIKNYSDDLETTSTLSRHRVILKWQHPEVKASFLLWQLGCAYNCSQAKNHYSFRARRTVGIYVTEILFHPCSSLNDIGFI